MSYTNEQRIYNLYKTGMIITEKTQVSVIRRGSPTTLRRVDKKERERKKKVKFMRGGIMYTYMNHDS